MWKSLLAIVILCLAGCSESADLSNTQDGKTLTLEILKKSHQIIVTEKQDVILVFNPSTDIYNAYWELLLFDNQLQLKDRVDFPSYWIYKVRGTEIFAHARRESAQTGTENYERGRRLGKYKVRFTDSLVSVGSATYGKLYSFDIDITNGRVKLHYQRFSDDVVNAHREDPFKTTKDSMESEWALLNQIKWIYPNKLTPPNGGIDVVTADARQKSGTGYIPADSMLIDRFLKQLLIKLKSRN